MTLSELTRIAVNWHHRRWGAEADGYDQMFFAAKLAEEVGEVAEAAIKTREGYLGADLLSFEDELADVVIVALSAAGVLGIDLDERVRAKLTKIGAFQHWTDGRMESCAKCEHPVGAHRTLDGLCRSCQCHAPERVPVRGEVGL